MDEFIQAQIAGGETSPMMIAQAAFEATIAHGLSAEVAGQCRMEVWAKAARVMNSVTPIVSPQIGPNCNYAD